jgi:hypothetical protein
MTAYIHLVRGRLRVKSPAIRRNHLKAGEARTLVEALHGVSSAETNLLTGSIVVRFDPRRIGHHEILTALQQANFITPWNGVRYRPAEAEGLSARVGATAGRAVIDALAEKMILRAAVAVIGSLI